MQLDRSTACGPAMPPPRADAVRASSVPTEFPRDRLPPRAARAFSIAFSSSVFHRPSCSGVR
eukprot:444347-Prymnesium_polylepis.2